MTKKSIQEIIDPSLCSAQVYREYCSRISMDSLTRDENIESHFCVYFLPFNPKTKEIFLIHHKKSGLWLSPGGHIDKGETVQDALKREIMEELGFSFEPTQLPKPFILTITPINNSKQPCKRHFDIWFKIDTDGSIFNLDPREFHSSKWLSINEARNIVVDDANIKALDTLENI